MTRTTLLTIVPTFASMYDSMGAQLPLITQIMVDMGKAMPYASPIIIAAVALAVFWKRNHNKDIIRTWWDPFTLKAPVFGKLSTNAALARFCNNFSSMLASGVPILQALDIVGSTPGNYVIEGASKRVGRLVERGYRLAGSMSTEKIFPNMMVQMVAIGEDSGQTASNLCLTEIYPGDYVKNDETGAIDRQYNRSDGHAMLKMLECGSNRDVRGRIIKSQAWNADVDYGHKGGFGSYTWTTETTTVTIPSNTNLSAVVDSNISKTKNW